MKSLSRVRLFATPWTVAYQAPPSMGFSWQEYWSGLPFPSAGDLPDPGIEPGSPAFQADTLTSEPPGKPTNVYIWNLERWQWWPWFNPWVWKIPWGRKWKPTPVLLPGESHGGRSLVGYSPWGPKEWDMTEPHGNRKPNIYNRYTHTHTHTHESVSAPGIYN